MSAAFDLLRSDILLARLGGISGKIQRFIMNFLTDRKAMTNYGDETSCWYPVPIGVPQGSVLGPKLFCIYTRGLAESIESEWVKLVSYADDAFVICAADDNDGLQARVTKTIIKHEEWLEKLGMVVNPTKTELMVLQDPKINVTLPSGPLAWLPDMRILGVQFDENMSWSKQLEKVVASCQRMKPALHVLNKKLSRNNFKKVISSHYFSVLYYASEVWFNCLSKKDQKKVASMHYWAVRMLVFDFKFKISRDQLDYLSKRASPFQLNNFKLAKLLISICNNTAPFVLFHELLSHSITERRTEHRPKFLDMSRKRIGRQSLSNRVTHVANKINFDWSGLPLSSNVIREKLKSSFFSY